MSTVDIIIPVYNEGNNIAAVLSLLEQSVKTPFRVLICYDFDEDTTLPVVRNYSSQSLEIVLVKNSARGPHSAVRSGFKASTSDAAIVFPADDTYNTNILDTMIKRFEEGYEIVAASRFMVGGQMRGCPWLKSFLIRASAYTLFYVARLPIHDPSNGFRLFSSRVLRCIPIESTNGFTYSIELLVKCHRLGWKIAEVPALWFERGKNEGKSNFKVVKWLPDYLIWFFYAFATTFLKRNRVKLTPNC
jgi:dolichol-phosphate mannosyltransferase